MPKDTAMGGEGSMMHAVNSLKENRKLLKKRKFKSVDDVFGKENSTLLRFKKSSPQDILRVQKDMQLQKQRNLKIQVVSFLITVLIILGIYLLLS